MQVTNVLRAFKALLVSAVLGGWSGSAWADSHCPPFAWHSIVSKGEQSMQAVGGGKLPDGRVLALVKFSGDDADWPKHSAVFLLKNGCYLGALVVARHGVLKTEDGELLYHADFYEPETTRLFTAQVNEPSMDEVWEWGRQLMAQPPQ